MASMTSSTGVVHYVSSRNSSLWVVFLEAFRERELLALLIKRQISIRYAQTAFGAAWVALQPLLSTAMYALVFGLFVKVDTGNIPYPLYAYSGSVLWTLFAQGLERGGSALVADERLVTKIYFPRLLLPFAAVLSGIVDLCVASLILVPYAWISASPELAALPLALVAIVPILLSSAGLATLLSSLNVRWRDLRQVAPFLVQLLVWATPVAYPIEMVPAQWRTAFLLNPATPAMQLFRSALLGSAPPPTWSIVAAFATSGALFLIGVMVFRSVERSFADYI